MCAWRQVWQRSRHRRGSVELFQKVIEYIESTNAIANSVVV